MNSFKPIFFLIIGVFSVIYALTTPTKMFPARRIGALLAGLALIILGICALLNLIKL